MLFNDNNASSFSILSQSKFGQEQGIDKHQAQDDGACPIKDGCTVLATCVGCMQLT